ncbi:hypothetical protein [Mesorhizobium sp. B2-6-4]|uniref:hypothetical protein n=1 Tax=Mesorhizobium sp. B2-6-4 TaxID=2589913 RepID=UPI00112ECB3E|nr:hypothetical protein [Mesorhizobium sp. B2-6-4]TPJ54767.1 hypothetical protein FJ426_07230 [Mesorhizobium sp. B2-6-4]
MNAPISYLADECWADAASGEVAALGTKETLVELAGYAIEWADLSAATSDCPPSGRHNCQGNV